MKSMGWFSDFKDWLINHKRLLQWIIAGVTLYLASNIVLSSLSDLPKLMRFDLEQIAILFAVFAAYLSVRAYSTLIVIRSAGGIWPSFWGWFKIYVVGRFANLLFAQSGNVYRATVLKKHYGVSYSKYINVNAFFIWLDSLLSLLTAFILTLGTQTSTKVMGLDIRGLAGMLSASVLAAPLVANVLFNTVHVKHGVISKALQFTQGIFAFVLDQGTDLRLIGRFIALDLTQFGIWILLYKVTLEGIGIGIEPVDLVMFLAIYKLGTFLVITPGNIGVREIAYAVLGEAVGIGKAEGVLVSTVIRIATYAVILPLGVIFGGAHLFKRREVNKTRIDRG